ncbi:MAG: integral rane protein [Candidatus Kaiserbacteria bacterium]|nr:integral rane protein [Candidatus Kaiserbacteria bacterium]
MIALISSAADWFLSLILLYKYVALFLISYVAALALPVPASTTVVAAGAFASAGYLNFPLVLLTALAANVAGDLTGFFAARRWGIRALSSLGLGFLVHTSGFSTLKRYLQNFPRLIIFSTRFVTEAGPAVNVFSGVTDLNTKLFVTYDILGEGAYVILYSGAGYILGSAWQDHIGVLTRGVFLIEMVGITFIVLRMFLRAYRTHR